MTRRRTTLRRAGPGRAFTLIELIATMLVLGVAAGMVTPLLLNLTDSARAARGRIASLDTLHHALDRAVRLLRHTPRGATGGVTLSEATPTSFTLGTGERVFLLGSTLWLDPGDASTWALANDVSSFACAYYEDDGVTQTADPSAMQRVSLSLTRDGVTLSAIVYLRTSDMPPPDDGDGAGEDDDDSGGGLSPSPTGFGAGTLPGQGNGGNGSGHGFGPGGNGNGNHANGLGNGGGNGTGNEGGGHGNGH